MWHMLLGLIKFVVVEGIHLSLLNMTYHIWMNSTNPPPPPCELSRLLNNVLIYVLILNVLVYMSSYLHVYSLFFSSYSFIYWSFIYVIVVGNFKFVIRMTFWRI
jgi:hypothetical protein